MAKKQLWKKAIRAQVAAALQGQPRKPAQESDIPASPSPAGRAGVGGSNQELANNPQHRSSTAPLSVSDLSYRQDVLRIGWVAVILLILLASLAVTDHRTQWLDRVAASATAWWQARSASPLPPAPSDGSVPAVESPSATPQSAPVPNE